MLFRIFTRRFNTPRTFSHVSPLRRGRTLALLALGASPFLLSTPIHADSETITAIKSTTTLRELIRTYMVYAMCSSETIVDIAPKSLRVLSSIPIVKQITEALVRVTFFDQFVGGDTAQETIPLLKSLRAANKGTLFAYSVEVDPYEATASTEKKGQGVPVYKQSVEEMIRCIDVAADFEDSILGNVQAGRRTWVAIKLTALLPEARALINLSSLILESRQKSSIPFPGCAQSNDLDVLYSSASRRLSEEDAKALRELHSDLTRICKRAAERNVKIIVDAEYSWYQPAVDAYQLSLMRSFNKIGGKSEVQPLIYGTFQAYLRRTPLHLAESFRDAEANKYALGVKLVRGAYHPHELAAHETKEAGKKTISISPDNFPPVWLTKEDTDRTYNECAKVLIGKLKADVKAGGPQRVGILFGTHNWSSCKLVLRELVEAGLGSVVSGTEDVVQLEGEVTERLMFGQLYGMSDALTDYLVNHTRSNAPVVIKYVPYGALSEVMPYLGRRAIENKSMLGNGAASEERRRAGSEIRKMIFG